MPIQNINVDYTGQIGILPRTVKIICNDTYDAVTAAGYLNDASIQGFNFYPTDIFLITLINNEFGIFQPVFTGNSITLVPWVSEGNVSLPVINGHLASFSGTTGLIGDSGFSSSSFQLSNDILAGKILYDGGSASPAAFTINGLPTTGIPILTISGFSNAAFIESAKILAANQLTILFSADPGAGTVVNYIIFKVPQ